MYTPTITYSDLKEGDLLFYRSNSVFGKLIRLWEAFKAGKFVSAFSHQAGIVYDRNLDKLRRFDAMEGYKTWFRIKVGKAYVFRWKTSPTPHQLMLYRQYLMAREWSGYDRLAIFWFMVNWIQEDPFKDVCSELQKNAWVASEKIEDSDKLSPFWFYSKYREEMDFLGIIL